MIGHSRSLYCSSRERALTSAQLMKLETGRGPRSAHALRSNTSRRNTFSVLRNLTDFVSRTKKGGKRTTWLSSQLALANRADKDIIQQGFGSMTAEVQRASSAPSLFPSEELVEATSNSFSRMVQMKQHLLQTDNLSESARKRTEKEMRRARAAAKLLAANERNLKARSEADSEQAAQAQDLADQQRSDAEEKRLEKRVSDPFELLPVRC